jgi:hypothetical protein
VRSLGRIERYDAEERGRFLLNRDALPLDVLGQLGERDLNPVVDVDGVDVRIGPELEGGGERVAAVISADALHVDHLVDADDLRFQRLGDGRVHHVGRSARIDRRDGDLRRDNVRILRHRNGEERQDPGDGRDDGDDDGEPWAIHEDG